MIRANKLERAFPYRDGQIHAVKELTCEIAAGQQVAIVGRSGSGKSTLLNLLAGLDRPTAGVLDVCSQRLDQSDQRAMAHYRLHTIGVIFQSFQLIAQRTALQNVELPLILAGVRPSERYERAKDWLQHVGLQARENHFPWQLSGGEQQRVAIARALINRPRVLLADEPTGNLDSENADVIIELLLKLCGEAETTVVTVTHDMEVARRCGQRLFRMHDGVLTEESIAAASAGPRTAGPHATGPHATGPHATDGAAP